MVSIVWNSGAAFLADVLNKTRYTSCPRAEGVRDYFHVGWSPMAGRGLATDFK
jgi:hypothetical protein